MCLSFSNNHNVTHLTAAHERHSEDSISRPVQKECRAVAMETEVAKFRLRACNQVKKKRVIDELSDIKTLFAVGDKDVQNFS